MSLRLCPGLLAASGAWLPAVLCARFAGGDQGVPAVHAAVHGSCLLARRIARRSGQGATSPPAPPHPCHATPRPPNPHMHPDSGPQGSSRGAEHVPAGAGRVAVCSVGGGQRGRAGGDAAPARRVAACSREGSGHALSCPTVHLLRALRLAFCPPFRPPSPAAMAPCLCPASCPFGSLCSTLTCVRKGRGSWLRCHTSSCCRSASEPASFAVWGARQGRQH